MDNQQEHCLDEYVPVYGCSKYVINKKGEIISFFKKNPRKLKTNKSPDTSGYIRISLTDDSGESKKYLLHRLVFFSFNPTPETELEINHKDGNKLNNHLDNLELVTRSDNLKHAYSIGIKSSSGVKNSTNILTEDQVLSIYDDLLKGVDVSCLVDRYGVSGSAIKGIKSKRNWNYLLKDLPNIETRKKSTNLAEESVFNVYRDVCFGFSWKDILLRNPEVTYDQVEGIACGRTYKRIINKFKEKYPQRLSKTRTSTEVSRVEPSGSKCEASLEDEDIV